MGTKIMVTPEQLETAAGKIEGLASDYKAQYEQLYAETNALASSWQGKDNVAFVNQIDGFKDDLKYIYDSLNTYVSFLRTSAKAYRDAQETVVRDAKSLKN